MVAGLLAITIEQRRDQEAVVAYDFDTGKERWRFQYPALFSETLGGDGPRATPTIHDDKVYSLGATGVLACLELATGRKLWEVNILEENGAGNVDWGMSGAPWSLAESSSSIPATKRALPRVGRLWRMISGLASGSGESGTARPVIHRLSWKALRDGRRLSFLTVQDWPGSTLPCPWNFGAFLGRASSISMRRSRCQCGDDAFFITSTTGAALIRVVRDGDKFAAEQVWKNNKLKCYFGTPVFYEGCLYGIDVTLLACVEAATGRQRWKARAGDYGHGQLLRSGALLLVLSETGALACRGSQSRALSRIGAYPGRRGQNLELPNAGRQPHPGSQPFGNGGLRSTDRVSERRSIDVQLSASNSELRMPDDAVYISPSVPCAL